MESVHVDAAATPGSADLPSLPVRLIRVFTSPGALFEALKENPKAAAALLLGAVLVTGATALIPVDVWSEMARAQALEAGRELPADVDMTGVFRIGTLVATPIFWVLWAFLIAGLVTLVFGFVLGDDGRFRQYLSVTTHAMLVPAVGTLAVTPLRVLQRDPQLTLNLGLFLPFLEEGYWLTVLRTLDLFMLWSWLVIAVGVHVVDRRRKVGTAAGVLVGFAVLLSLGLAAIIPR